MKNVNHFRNWQALQAWDPAGTPRVKNAYSLVGW